MLEVILLFFSIHFSLSEYKKGEDFFYDSLIVNIKRNGEKVFEAEYFKSKRDKNAPLIVFFPILGPFDPSRFLAGIFMIKYKFKVDILILSQERYIFWRNTSEIDSKEKLIKSLKKMKKDFYWRMKSLEFYIEELKKRGRAKKVFLIGISYGGIEGVFFALDYKKIDYAVIINAGGNISEIITESAEKEIRDNLKRIKVKLNLSDENLKNIIQENLSNLDPLTLPVEISASKFLIISSFHDRIVPYRYQKILWRYLKKPERVLLPYGHRGVILYFFNILNKIFKRFDENLKEF